MKVLTQWESAVGRRKMIAVLIDPDKFSEQSELLKAVILHPPDIILVGGSLITVGNVEACVNLIRSYVDIPIVLFPGSQNQFTKDADALLLLSLISGRNPDLLIGQHVQAAMQIASSKVEVIPTGYVLIDGGTPTSVSYMSQTTPIPGNKPEIAAATALAGVLLGLRCIYLDAGSGAVTMVSQEIIAAVREQIHVPLMVGGGIRSVEKALCAFKAGADIVVVGTVVEERPEFLFDLKEMMQKVLLHN